MGQRHREVQVWLIDVNQVPPLSRAAVGLLGDEERAHPGALRGGAGAFPWRVSRPAAHWPW